MRLAIIGGTGFVGRYLTDKLLGAGHSVSLLVRKGSESKLRHSEQVNTMYGDIADNDSIRCLLLVPARTRVNILGKQRPCIVSFRPRKF